VLKINFNILVHSWAFGQCQLTLGVEALQLFSIVACVFFGETHSMLIITMGTTEINSLSGYKCNYLVYNYQGFDIELLEG
jgi:hypothetical protein